MPFLASMTGKNMMMAAAILTHVFDLLSYGIWVGISITWVSVAAAIIIFLPIIEARKGIAQVFGRKRTPVSTGDKK